jgi:hypothetical protein
MVEIIIQKIAPVSVPVVSSDSLWAEFGQLKIADSTRKQYVKAIENFCQFAYSGSATPETISAFLDLDRYAAIEMVLRYRRHSIDRNLAPSTINVRLAAIKSLVEMARKLGKTTIDLSDIEYAERLAVCESNRGEGSCNHAVILGQCAAAGGNCQCEYRGFFTPAAEVDDFGEGETSEGGDRSD